MSRPSVQILSPSLEPSINRVGDKVKAAGQYGNTTGLHTIAMTLMNFRGRVYLEGSLATDPFESDWFQLPPTSDLPYFEFPNEQFTSVNPLNPTIGYTGTMGFTFQCNCLWIRARVDRSYLIPETASLELISTYGSVDTIIGNFALGGVGTKQDIGVLESIDVTNIDGNVF